MNKSKAMPCGVAVLISCATALPAAAQDAYGLRIRCAKLDTTIQDYVVELLDRELSEGRRPSRTTAPTGGARRE